uniref:RING-type domain-containing protein n=1 Tax=Strongyloides papillosus TaxID=174720 RepID=A0A0N5BEM0_STREA
MFSNGGGSNVLEESSPMECPICRNEMISPMIFGTCYHTLCDKCSATGKNEITCPLCKTKNTTPPEEDEVMKYIIECSKDETDVCGNCDSIIAPMYFCETCSLPLCSLCRVSTHMAKIFGKHTIIPLEERGKIRGSLICMEHEQPYILYNLDTSQLLCIGCFNKTPNDERGQLVNIDVGHKICSEKLDAITQHIKRLQEEIKEHIEMRKRILLELNENYKNSEKLINYEFDKVIEKIKEKKESSLRELQNEKEIKEAKINEQLETLIHLQFPIRQNLLTSTIFCSYISKLDFLHMYDKLMKKLNETSHCDIEKLEFTSELTSGSNINFNAVFDDPTHHSQPPDPEMVFPILLPSVSNGPFLNISDITTESEELLRKIEMPLKSFFFECSSISHELQEAQKDITQRRCLINDTTIDSMIDKCKNLKNKIDNHISLIKSYQPILRQIWQSNLDNVRREQSIFKTKLEESSTLGDNINNLTLTAEKIKPFLDYLTSVVYTVNEKLVKPPDLAPMERICMEICTIEPDSKTRCEAIEKEEEARRHAQEQKSCNEKIDFMNATVKNLKHSKDGMKRKPKKKTKAFLSDHSCILASDDRDRNSFKAYSSKTRTNTMSSCESMTSLLDDSEIIASLRLGGLSPHHHASIQSISPTTAVLEEEEPDSIPPTPDHLKEIVETQGNNTLSPPSRPSSQLGGVIMDPKIVKQKLLADIKEKVPLQPAVGEDLNDS